MTKVEDIHYDPDAPITTLAITDDTIINLFPPANKSFGTPWGIVIRQDLIGHKIEMPNCLFANGIFPLKPIANEQYYLPIHYSKSYGKFFSAKWSNEQ